MPDDPCVQRLIEEMLDSGRSAEEVCHDSPELLNRVREHWKRFRALEAWIDEIFPEPGLAEDRGGLPPQEDLPRAPGYEILGVLGRGGIGVVYKAMHLRLNRTVALKTLLVGAFATRTERQRFAREAELVAGLRHPNVVQVYDVGDLGGRPYFTMEFVEGGSLADAVAGTPWPARQAAELVAALADAIATAHRGGVVHRDLKPSNVLLTADGTPKVTDFGLARRLEVGSSLTQSGAAVGTPSYMAPEQARGRTEEIGPAADLYALGAILYELLTGRPPFRAESAAETVHQVLTQDPVPPSRLYAKVPRDLETICLKCLHKEPRLRYVTASALADDLRRFLDGRPILARPVGWAGRAWRWGRRSPAEAGLIASVLMLVGLALGGGLWLARQRAAQRAETARQEGRTWQAAEAALEQARALQVQGRWQEARAVLAAAPNLAGAAAPPVLAEQLSQARADADTAAELEDIRLGMSEGWRSHRETVPVGTLRYSGAFRKYGVDLSTPDLTATAERVRRSAIRDTLLAYLHDWLYWVSDEHRATLRTLLDRADDDGWRRSYREALAVQNVGKLKALASAPGAANQPPVILSGLGGTLLANELRDETLALMREAQRRNPDDFWINYLLGHFLEQDRPHEAVGFFRAAVALRPRSDQAYTLLGRALRGLGDADGAAAALREAVTLNPTTPGIWDLARALAPAGRLEEVRAVWEKYLEGNPTDHESWHGYAQLCLFLGNEDEYRRVRKASLDRFGEEPSNWIIAERTAVACLLLPEPGDDLRRAAALADWAVTDAARRSRDDNPFVRFAAGLAAYRRGRPDAALPLLRDAAGKIKDRAGPGLVLAMAQFRSGSTKDARQTLATALRAHDWKTTADETRWVSQVLRREAEALILPDVPPFRRGGDRPLEDDERLALAELCRSKHLYRSAAILFMDGFAVDPQLADDLTADCIDRAARAARPGDLTEILNAEHRYLAARCAALVGCGRGNDGVEIGDVERARWRRRAHEWLLRDLAIWAATEDGGTRPTRDHAERMLSLWQTQPDFAALREPADIEKLPADERKEWLTLWSEVDRLHERAGRAK